jgi:hypothetical protein
MGIKLTISIFAAFLVSYGYTDDKATAAPTPATQPSPSAPELQFTTAPQCKCKDIEECSQDILKRVNKCKVAPQCEKYITKIGNAVKIRACLDKEHSDMKLLEDCVIAKVGALGCTNDEIPANLTIPLIPVVEAPEVFEADDAELPEVPMAAPPMEPPQGPPELTQFLMCVDQCSMAESLVDASVTRRKRSAVNCAFKLRCALSPPDQKVQDAFQQCEKDLNIDPIKKFKDSCQCLVDAGVAMQCPQ